MDKGILKFNIIFWLIIIFLFIGIFIKYSYASETEEFVAIAIQKLQPNHNSDVAMKLAQEFVDAGQQTRIDPLLLVAISFRESSLRNDVVGSIGEIGLMQVHGVALHFRPSECYGINDMSKSWCQILTGARFLERVRTVCPGSTWRWVVSYGMSRCATEEEARRHHSGKNAYRYYKFIGGTQWQD